MEKFRLYIKSIPITFETWIISFVGIVFIRAFFEQFSGFKSGYFIIINTPSLAHATAYYLAASTILMVILMLFAKISMREALGICILGSFLICLPPIIDLIFGGVGGYVSSYLFISGEELLPRLLTLVGGHITSGATLGIQVQFVLVVIFCIFYIYKITKNIFRVIGAVVSLYLVIFFLFSMPSLIALLLPEQSTPAYTFMQSIFSSHIIQNNIHPEFSATRAGLIDLGFDKVMLGINIIITFLASLFFFFIGVRKKFIAIVKNCRLNKIIHYSLLFTLGASLVDTTWFNNWIDVQAYVLALIAFACAWMFSVCQNDIHDEAIDAISNKDRPLISGVLSKNDMQLASKIFLFFALVCGYASSHYVLFFICLFLFVYFIYSNPPLRLKRFPVLSSFLISIACLSTTLAGFFLLSYDKSIVAFPLGFALAIIIFFTLATNLRDIKDIEGNRANGIKTIPVLLGAKKSKRLIAGVICLSFLLIPPLFRISFLFIPSIVISILSWYFITKKNYKEWEVSIVFLVWYIILITSIIILK